MKVIEQKTDEEKQADLYDEGLEALNEWYQKYLFKEPMLKVPLLEMAYDSWLMDTEIGTCFLAFERMKAHCLADFNFDTMEWEKEEWAW